MTTGEMIHSGQIQSSDLCSPEPNKSNIQQGINTFLKENGFSVSPMNYSSTFPDEQLTHHIDHPPIISLVTQNPSNNEIEQEGFFHNFQNIIQSFNRTSVTDDLIFSELDIARQKMAQQEERKEQDNQDFESQELFSTGLANNFYNRNQSIFQRAYQSDSKKQKNQKQFLEDQKATNSSHNQNQELLEELSKQEQSSSTESCKCTNSKCLKLYCVCFSHGEFCQSSCKCISCCNTSSNYTEVKEARKNTLSRNPHAFSSKVEIVLTAASIASPIRDKKGLDGSAILGHKKGCKCKRTFCKKKYCECFNAGVKCSYICICEGCHNKEEKKNEVEQKKIEGDQNGLDKPTFVQENKKPNKRPFEPFFELSEENPQVLDTSLKESETDNYLTRKKQKIQDNEEYFESQGQEFHLNVQQYSPQEKNVDIYQIDQLGEYNQGVKQLLFEFETPTFKILNKQDFDPNSIIRKNIPNSNFTLDYQ